MQIKKCATLRRTDSLSDTVHISHVGRYRDPIEVKETSEIFHEGKSSEKMTGAKGGKMGTGQTLSLPPRRQLTPNVSHVIRYACSSGVTAQAITTGNLASACGCVATSTTQLQPWAGSVRLKWIRIYSGTSASGFTIAQVAWTASNGFFIPDEEWNQMAPEGSATPTVNTFRPPKFSIAANWIDGTLTGNMFRITAPPGSIIDVALEWRLSNQFLYSPVPVATALLGRVYYGYLDGATSHLIQPQGLPSTF